MHFLGFNVMPRRMPDFPDYFHSWNFLSSIGSGITFLSFAILWKANLFEKNLIFLSLFHTFVIISLTNGNSMWSQSQGPDRSSHASFLTNWQGFWKDDTETLTNQVVKKQRTGPSWKVDRVLANQTLSSTASLLTSNIPFAWITWHREVTARHRNLFFFGHFFFN